MAAYVHGSGALFGLGLLIVGVSRSHSCTPQPIGILCTSGQPDAKTST
jgi:hypothetical protein